MIRTIQLLFITFSCLIAVVVVLGPTPTYAQDDNPLAVDCNADPIRCGTNQLGDVTTPLADPNESYLLLGGLISTVINIILIGAGLTGFVFFIIGAIQWGTAGSGDGAAKGRMTMIYAAMGLVMVALVYVFILFFNSLTPSALPTPECPVDTTC